jgi:hypothetical protein
VSITPADRFEAKVDRFGEHGPLAGGVEAKA